MLWFSVNPGRKPVFLPISAPSWRVVQHKLSWPVRSNIWHWWFNRCCYLTPIEFSCLLSFSQVCSVDPSLWRFSIHNLHVYRHSDQTKTQLRHSHAKKKNRTHPVITGIIGSHQRYLTTTTARPRLLENDSAKSGLPVMQFTTWWAANGEPPSQSSSHAVHHLGRPITIHHPSQPVMQNSLLSRESSPASVDLPSKL